MEVVVQLYFHFLITIVGNSYRVIHTAIELAKQIHFSWQWPKHTHVVILNRWGDHYISPLFKQSFHSFKKYNMAGCMLGRDKTCRWANIRWGEGRDPWCEGKDSDVKCILSQRSTCLEVLSLKVLKFKERKNKKLVFPLFSSSNWNDLSY